MQNYSSHANPLLRIIFEVFGPNNNSKTIIFISIQFCALFALEPCMDMDRHFDMDMNGHGAQGYGHGRTWTTNSLFGMYSRKLSMQRSSLFALLFCSFILPFSQINYSKKKNLLFSCKNRKIKSK